MGITRPAVGQEVCATTAGIKRYKSIFKKNKNKNYKIHKIIKSNTMEVLISKIVTDSYISHDEFISVNNALREYDDMKEEIKNLKTLTVHQRF